MQNGTQQFDTTARCIPDTSSKLPEMNQKQIKYAAMRSLANLSVGEVLRTLAANLFE